MNGAWAKGPRTVAGTTFAIVLVMAGGQEALGQEPAEPVHERLASALKRDYASFGVLLQTVGEWQPDRVQGTDGFSIPNFRLLLSGELDRGLGYAFQANLVRSPAVLDARLYFDLASWASVDVGQFKAPFSKELLVYAANLDFAERSQVVSALAPGRQLGAQVRLRTPSPAIEWSAGLFNGNGIAPGGNDDDAFLVVGRAQWTGSLAGGSTLEVGASAARSTADETSPGGAFLSGFTGTRTLFGADLRWTGGPWLVAAEGAGGALEPAVGPRREPKGFYVTGGRRMGERALVLVRWDSFDADRGQSTRDVLVLALDWRVSSAGLLRFNWLVDARGGPAPHRWVAVAQLGF